MLLLFFFFNDTATTEIYTLSLHDALPIWPKGYFPVPAITHLEGKVLDLVRDALSSDAARDRGLFRPEYVQELIGDPNGELTPLKGNKLWQLGLLELWLQSHGV